MRFLKIKRIGFQNSAFLVYFLVGAKLFIENFIYLVASEYDH